MAIDIDRMTRRDVAEGNQALPQGSLKIQGDPDRDSLEEAVLGGWRREKGETGEEAEVGAADRIDSANASSIAKDRLEDEAQGKALLWEPCALGGPKEAARSEAPSWRRYGMKKKPPALVVVSPRLSRAVTSCSMS